MPTSKTPAATSNPAPRPSFDRDALHPAPRPSFDRDALQIPALSTIAGSAGAPAGGRSPAASAVQFAPRGSSLTSSPAPGSFVSDLRGQPAPSRAASRLDAYGAEKVQLPDVYDSSGGVGGDDDDMTASEQRLLALRDMLNRELKIKEGSENMLEALNTKKAKQAREQRQRVEAELQAANQRIRDLRQRISDAQRPRLPTTTPARSRTDSASLAKSGGAGGDVGGGGGGGGGVVAAGIVAGGVGGGYGGGGNSLRSPLPKLPPRSETGSDVDDQAESPTFVLAEILQALEVEGMPPEYYVARSNSLVDLFKRHPTLKYDLVWSVFGLRIQSMLLSDSREIVAAAYRMTRYAISDAASLRKIRALNTDYLVVLSLIKDRKADVEREQALKFVRAFLDAKDGVRELSRAVVRTIAAVAEHTEDRLRPICLETLAEILVRDPRLLIASGGLSSLSDALAEGAYKAPESLTSAILFLLDAPQRRRYLRAGYELEVLFTAFTDQYLSTDAVLKQNAKAIASAMKTWPGLMALSMYNFRAIRSLVSSLSLPSTPIRETVIELVYSLLRIKSPAWASSFLAGRRLTTYGRVTNLKASQPPPAPKGLAGLDTSAATAEYSSAYADDGGGEQNFVDHYTALLLAVFVRSDLVPQLLHLAQEADNNSMLKRKSTLLIGEILRLSSRLLPPSWSEELQLLPELFAAATRFKDESHFTATGTVYQISSVSRTLYRSSPSSYNHWTAGTPPPGNNLLDFHLLDEQPKAGTNTSFDEATFRQSLLDSGVLSSSNFLKWDWAIILKIIEGPLTNGKRLEEAMRASKFVKRLMSFYRPFKYKFSEFESTRATQKYVRVGCALVHTLLQTPEGVRYLGDSKLLRQIAECLAQCDPTSGITAQFPMFSRDRLTDTLCGGYLPMIGVLSSDPRGLQMMERWRMFNMMYHIVDLKQRPDLIKLLLSHFDYTLNGHHRVLLSKALTAGTKDIRIHATNVLRKYAIRSNSVTSSSLGRSVGDAKWAIQFLVTQLYDPEVEVCATAVKILEKACNSKSSLDFIVECRPALDHLGEIGAPLLLRFLSTSIGYHYLDGLDYISNEMDDWFLGRNDAYVDLIEASLARAFVESSDEQAGRIAVFADENDADTDAHIPPHFYRELTRTEEGCRLLREKGHFDDFAATIREHGMQTADPELITKVKGCLWAVGNVGAMELGAPFLESSDVVQNIVDIVRHHEVMSLRGTAFFVLGLISRSLHGMEILSECGWDSNTSMLGASLGFCIPTDLSQLFSLAPWKHEATTAITLPDSQKTERAELPVVPFRPQYESLASESGARGEGSAATAGPQDGPLLDSDPTNQRILELVVDMGNTVLFKRTATELMQIRNRKSTTAFSQPRLFRKVLSILERRHYRLLVRRIILELFDKSVLRSIVFGEGDDEDSDDEDDEDEDEDEDDEEEEEEDEEEEDEEDADDDDDDDDEDEEDEDEDDGAGVHEGHSKGGTGNGLDAERRRSTSDPMELQRRVTARRRRAV